MSISKKKYLAQDFTPTEIAQKMCAMFPQNNFIQDQTFLDPACGEGSLLCEILKRKLQYHNEKVCLFSIYGADVDEEVLQKCKQNLYKIVQGKINKDLAFKILNRNIIYLPLEKYPNGSLDFDFNIENKKQTLEDLFS